MRLAGVKLSVGICIQIDRCRTGASAQRCESVERAARHCTGARVRREVRGRVWNIAFSAVCGTLLVAQ